MVQLTPEQLQDPTVTSLQSWNQAAPPDTMDQPTSGEVLGASFTRYNNAVNLFENLTEDTPDPVEGYDPFLELNETELSFAEQFQDSRSPAETEKIRERLNTQFAARDLLANASTGEQILAGLVAGIADVDTLIPFGAVAKLNKGRVVAGALVGGGTAAASELALIQNSPDRDNTEAFVALLAGAGIGAIGGHLINRATNTKFQDTVETYVKNAEASNVPDAIGAAAGAQVSRPLTPEETKIASRATRALAKTFRLLDPGGKGIVSPGIALRASDNSATREIINELSESSVELAGGRVGKSIGASVETEVKAYDRFAAEAVTAIRLGRSASGLGRTEFAKEVAFAMRRGDVHTNPSVQKTAEALRKEVFEPFKKEAASRGLIPEDIEVSTAASYLTRVYDKRKIQQTGSEFVNRVADWLRTQDIPDVVNEADLFDIARNVQNNILGQNNTLSPFISMGKAGPLKERTFNIPDPLIEDFLVNDIEAITRAYVKRLAPQLVFARRYDTVNPMELFTQRIRDAQEKQLEGVTGKAAERITSSANRELDTIQAIVNRVNGFPGRAHQGYSGLDVPERIVRGARKVANAAFLSNVVVSSLPDITRIAMEEGLTRSMGLMFRGLGNGFREVRLGKQQAQLLGTALDNYLATRVRAYSDVGDPVDLNFSKAENLLERGEQKFFQATGINHWNTGLKAISSTLASTRILKAAEKLAAGKSLSKGDLSKLTRSGISEEVAARIGQQSQHWKREGGAIFGNIDDWDDLEAIEAFRNAIIADADRTIVTPGVADLPIWLDGPYTSLIGHLKTFAFASSSRVLFSAVDQRNSGVVTGIAASVALGALSGYIKDQIAGRETKTDARSLVAEGIDRSGILALAVSADDIGAKLMGTPSLMGELKGEDTGRFNRTADSLEAISPAFSLLKRTGRDVRKAVKSGETEKLWSLVPLHNHFLVAGAFEAIDQATGSDLRRVQTQGR